MPPQVSYTQEESDLLQLVTQPSGNTIEQLAQKVIEYERVQVRAAEVFALDPAKLDTISKAARDPETRPPNFLPTNDPNVSPRRFGQKGSVKVDELKAVLAEYDEALEAIKRNCNTPEEYVTSRSFQQFVHQTFLI